MASVSMAEYLKRYESTTSATGKVRKKKKLRTGTTKKNIRIMDNDILFRNARAGSDEEQFDLKEEKPILLAEDGTTLFTDEYQQKEQEKKDRWAPIVSKQSKNSVPSRKRHDSSSDDEHANSNVAKTEKFQQTKEKLRATRHDSPDSDLSPPRKQSHKNSKRSDKSNEQSNQNNIKKCRHDSSDSDLSPDRGGAVKKESDSDLSPQRGGGGDDLDLSPDRTNGLKDLTPVRNKNKNDSSSNWDKKNASRKEVEAEVVKKGGLKTASELRIDNDQRRREQQRKMAALGVEESGRGAETVYRDKKSGKKVDLKLEALEKRNKEEDQAKENEQFATWGKGVAQTASYEQRLQEDVHEANKPLARYADDADLDEMLRNEVRTEDPMAAFLGKKSTAGKNKPERPRYKGAAPPPNRFNLWPGYRWDGVNRSNGFEKKRFAAISDRQTFEHEKFKWSSEAL